MTVTVTVTVGRGSGSAGCELDHDHDSLAVICLSRWLTPSQAARQPDPPVRAGPGRTAAAIDSDSEPDSASGYSVTILTGRLRKTRSRSGSQGANGEKTDLKNTVRAARPRQPGRCPAGPPASGLAGRPGLNCVTVPLARASSAPAGCPARRSAADPGPTEAARARRSPDSKNNNNTIFLRLARLLSPAVSP